MSDDNESILVKLTRMEGKLDLSNLRHDQTDAWKLTVDQRLHGHGVRISGLEAKDQVQEGERRGVSIAVKALWTLGGGSIVAVAAFVARALGA